MNFFVCIVIAIWISSTIAFAYPTASSLMLPKLAKLPPLHYSAYTGGLQEVERLLTSGEAKIDDLDEDGNTALHWATFADTTVIAERLITKYQAPLDIRNKDGRTFLANAAALHREDMLRLALKHDDNNIDVRNTWGKTPLLEAVTATIEGDAEREKAAPLEVITELLFDAGADPHIADDYGRLPMEVVAEYLSATVLKQFMNAGVVPMDRYGSQARNALHLVALSASSDSLEKIQMLVDRKNLSNNWINHEAPDADGYNATDLAVRSALTYRDNQSYVDYEGDGSGPKKARARDKKIKLRILEGVKLLFEQRGVFPNSGNTLVQALFSDADTAKLLMGYGVDLHQPNAKGVTPLMAASAAGNVEAVEAILADPDVDVEAVDDEGKTALGYAVGGLLGEGVSAVKPLLEYGVEVDNEYGRIAFRSAVKNDNVEVTRLLLERVTAGDHASNPVPSKWIAPEQLPHILQGSEVDNSVWNDYGTDMWLYGREHVFNFARSKEMKKLLQSYGIGLPSLQELESADSEEMKLILHSGGDNIPKI